MELDEVGRIDGVLGGKVGPLGRWYLYPRDRNTPMNFVLREAEKDLGAISNYWLDQTPGDVFCLSGFSTVVAALGTRYVELWADVRALSMNTVFSGDLKPALAERLALKVIAEFSLLRGDPEVAVCAMLRAAMTSNGIVVTPNTVGTLQQEPLDTPYMGCWFYGMCHELGHLMEPRRAEGVAQAYPDAYMFELVEWILRNVPGFEGLSGQALGEARAGRADFLQNPGVLRSEAIGDIFAAVCLLNATSDVMGAERQAAADPSMVPPFDVFAMAYEMFLSVVVHGLLGRCRREAADGFERALQPAAGRVRLYMLRNHFSGALTRYVFGPEASAEQRAQIDGILERSLADLDGMVSPMETGFARAISFALDGERRPDVGRLFEEWGAWSGSQNETVVGEARAELRAFCDRASAWGMAGAEVQRLVGVGG